MVVTPQPVLALSWLQLEFSRVVPDCDPAVLMLQPAAVWRVIWSVPARLTPSITSISPELGQFYGGKISSEIDWGQRILLLDRRAKMLARRHRCCRAYGQCLR